MNMIKADTGKIMDGMKIIAVLYLPFLIKTLNLIFVKTIKYTNWIRLTFYAYTSYIQ